jgi:hypothetical protein
VWTFSKVGTVQEVTGELHDAPILHLSEESTESVVHAKLAIIGWMNKLPSSTKVNVTIISRNEYLACQASIKL